MKNIAVICAMKEEFDALVNTLNLTIQRDQCRLKNEVYLSNYCGLNIVVGICGIGKVNAAIFTQHIIDKYNIDYILNVGVAGSLNEQVTLGDIVVATNLVYHDVDAREFNYELGQVPRLDVLYFESDAEVANKIKYFNNLNFTVYFGTVATGDQFISNIEKALFIKEHFNSIACEMEAAAIAHTAYLNGVKFTVIKGLSDMAGLDSQSLTSYKKFLNVSSLNSSIIIKNILDSFY